MKFFAEAWPIVRAQNTSATLIAYPIKYFNEEWIEMMLALAEDTVKDRVFDPHTAVLGRLHAIFVVGMLCGLEMNKD